MKDHELYHRIADAACSRVRAALATSPYAERTSFHNIGTGTRDIAALKAMTGNDEVPTLKTPTGILRGEKEILAYFRGGQSTAT